MPELVVDVTPLVRMEAMLDRLAKGQLPNTQEAMRQTSVMLFSAWKQRAADTPGVYRKPDYLAGLVPDDSIREIDALSVDIIHTQPEIARQVHKGVPSHDMKPYLVGTLRGSPRPSNPSIMGNAREIRYKGRVVGRYNVIPFRHKVAGMPKEIYPQAKALAASTTRLTAGKEQRTQWGGRLTDSQVEAISKSEGAKRAYTALVKARKARKLSSPTFGQFLSRFKGMARVVKGYERATQAKYMTFRAVSVRTDGRGGSPAGSWIFPGWYGVDFPREVFLMLAKEVRDNIVKGLVLDFQI